MKIIITGSAGFIGFHLSNNLLKSKENQILGIDSINNYYSTQIKKLRLKQLLKNKNFIFKKINIANKKKIDLIFEKFKPDVVFHLAGQPGVLYSFKNPNSYKLNNTNATKVISNASKKYKVKNFVFASSSSVYGDQKKFPIKETYKLNPKNPYAITKLKSEKIICKNFKNTKINYMIFRFFSVYGPLGRPDMFIHKFLNSIKKNKQINLYNRGLNYRDFTFIEDVVKILSKSIKIKIKNRILNICRSQPILTNDLVDLVLKIYKKKKAKIRKTKFIKGEMLKTHGSNKNLKKNFGKIKFTDIKRGLKETIKQYKIYGY